MRFIGTTQIADFLKTTSDGRQLMLAYLSSILLSETMDREPHIRRDRQFVAELHYSNDLQSIAASTLLTAVMELVAAVSNSKTTAHHESEPLI